MGWPEMCLMKPSAGNKPNARRHHYSSSGHPRAAHRALVRGSGLLQVRGLCAPEGRPRHLPGRGFTLTSAARPKIFRASQVVLFIARRGGCDRYCAPTWAAKADPIEASPTRASRFWSARPPATTITWHSTSPSHTICGYTLPEAHRVATS